MPFSQDNLRWLKRQESLKSQRQRKISNELSLASLTEEQAEDVQDETTTTETRERATNERNNGSTKENTDNEKMDDVQPKVSTEDTSGDNGEIKPAVESQENIDAVAAASAAEVNAAEDEDDYDASVEEKELTYLNFIRDVTSDLLSTGRLSERILAEIFKRHVEEYGEDKIPPEKAEELHRQLRKDVGLGGAGSEADEGEGLTKTLVKDMDALLMDGEEGKAGDGEGEN